MCKRLLKRKRENPLNVKSAKAFRITLNVLVLRSFPVTLMSIVSSLSLGEVTCLLTLDTCLMFSLVTIPGKKQI